MQTLGDLYKEFLHDEVFENIGVEYIQEILSTYGKECLNITKMLDKLARERVKHIVSMFFMGKLLYESSAVIKEAMNDFINSSSLFPDSLFDNTQKKFDFIWMLTAFYHDVGYVLENKELVCMRKITDMLNFEYPMEYGKRFVPECYDDDLLNSYAWYRFITSRKCDHGIVGAQNFYNELISTNPGKRIPTYNVYEVVCLCIACHNVWFPNEDTISIYKAFGLSKLADVYENSVDKKVRVIEVKNHSLLFLLSLADNIEPSKRYHDFNWLQNVSFELSSDSNCISISDSSHNKDYIDSVFGLNSWLVDVEQITNEKNSVILHIS